MKNSKKIEQTLRNVIEHEWAVVDLRNCGLTEIPQELYNHPDIVSIDLSNTKYAEEHEKNVITEIPDEIGNLKNLTRLNFENNKIVKLSPNIVKLPRLKYLNLNNNNLVEISEKIANMKGLEELKILDNPFDMLPPEIIARGIESVRNFFKELKEQDFIFEVKLLIVGEGRVGKTCLSNALIQKKYILEDEVSTEGININRWIIPKNEIKKINPKITRDFQINIWDFGGQEIYHSTHQFFLTKRSLYLLVTESRKEDSHDDFFYWLNIIKLLGDKSPVVMALNKADQPTKELPIKEYKSTFNNIISFEKISLKNDFRDNFNKFKNELINIASNLPHIGNPLPKVWVDIRRDIEKLKLSGKNYISLEEYLSICKKHYRNEESALFLSEYFHDLGVIIHFQNDIELRDIVILNHEWITKGVYKILDDREVINNKGKFSHEDIDRIWSNDDHKFKKRELLSLMKNAKFDLCFELKDGNYLVPRLLPVDEVEHNWKPSVHNTKFEFRYKFMPKGILARLIVKMNSDIFDQKYWRYGVILNYEETFAIIKEKYFENKITIELNGPNKREFLFLIRKNINEIHNDFNRLEVEEMIPCNCELCSESNEPFFYKFNTLKRFEAKEISEIRCENSLNNVSVYELTSDIVRKCLNEERIIVCENQTANLLSGVNFPKTKFFAANNNTDVFIKINAFPDYYGLRDRDFLLDSEIIKINEEYPNMYILDYYCIENYLYHPDNIAELQIDLNISEYKNNIIKQKNEAIKKIIAIFKKSRDSYQEFKNTSIRVKDDNEIIDYLDSDDIEIFFKAYSMKDKFNKSCLEKYQLKEEELAETKWFKDRMNLIINNNGDYF
ncbi:MAG: GTP-binding protein [Chlorobi bacterium]|nr:GTP-binding protein [Chlorobiota bacterium]